MQISRLLWLLFQLKFQVNIEASIAMESNNFLHFAKSMAA